MRGGEGEGEGESRSMQVEFRGTKRNETATLRSSQSARSAWNPPPNDGRAWAWTWRVDWGTNSLQTLTGPKLQHPSRIRDANVQYGTLQSSSIRLGKSTCTQMQCTVHDSTTPAITICTNKIISKLSTALARSIPMAQHPDSLAVLGWWRERGPRLSRR